MNKFPASLDEKSAVRVWRAAPEYENSGRSSLCRRGGLGFGFGGGLSALDVGVASFPFFGFVVLLAHNGLYFGDAFRLFVVA